MSLNLGSSSGSWIGSFSKVGGGAADGIEPVLVKAGVHFKNSDSAEMPSLVLRISGRETVLDTFSRMLR